MNTDSVLSRMIIREFQIIEAIKHQNAKQIGFIRFDKALFVVLQTCLSERSL